MIETKKICKNCPMRRDSNRRRKISSYSSIKWYQRCFWPCWKLPVCEKQTDKICLGALIHVRNEYATVMLKPELREIAIQYEEDHELIFSSNGEFIRYHRGEDFGSISWYQRSLAYKFSQSQKLTEEENGGQYELF